MYFNFKNFLLMSLFIEQANLSLPTTKTTEMIEISIIFIILLIYDIFEKKMYRPRYRLFEADTQKMPIPILRHITNQFLFNYASSLV